MKKPLMLLSLFLLFSFLNCVYADTNGFSVAPGWSFPSGDVLPPTPTPSPTPEATIQPVNQTSTPTPTPKGTFTILPTATPTIPESNNTLVIIIALSVIACAVAFLKLRKFGYEQKT